jgi:alpha-beta hydrolase superfamily lysophospholipase
MENEVNDVLAVAATAGEPVVLAGHSSGAVVALEAALASPAQVAGMVLYEPPVAVTDRWAATRWSAQKPHWQREIRAVPWRSTSVRSSRRRASSPGSSPWPAPSGGR